jgi:hypothetical protein
MADFRNAIPAFPADLRGKETAIPAGYLRENKKTAGIAGIETNPQEVLGILFRACPHAIARARNIKGLAAIPAFPAELAFSIT